MPALVLLVICGACSETGEQEMDILWGKDVLNRGQAKERLRTGVRINVNVCPQHTVAGWYAISYSIPAYLNDTHYDAGQIEACMFLLAAVPCVFDVDNNQVFRLNLYNAFLEVCKPSSVGPSF